MAFRWRADDGPLIVIFGSSHPSSTKKQQKNVVKVRPPLTKFSGSATCCKFQILVRWSKGLKKKKREKTTQAYMLFSEIGNEIELSSCV